MGVGNVGSAIANNIIVTGQAKKLYLVDIDRQKLEAEFLEFRSLARILNTGVEVIKTIDIPHSDIYIITAGTASNSQKMEDSMTTSNPVETTPKDRMALFSHNKAQFEDICQNIAKTNPEGILLTVTNPSGELSKIALDYCHHVVAIGNGLDNARYKDSHLYGPHEKPRDFYKEIVKGKGFTNWGVAGEVLKTLRGFV